LILIKLIILINKLQVLLKDRRIQVKVLIGLTGIQIKSLNSHMLELKDLDTKDF